MKMSLSTACDANDDLYGRIRAVGAGSENVSIEMCTFNVSSRNHACCCYRASNTAPHADFDPRPSIIPSNSRSGRDVEAMLDLIYDIDANETILFSEQKPATTLVTLSHCAQV